MIAKPISRANSVRGGWLVAALLLSLAAGAVPAMAQSAKLAELPPPPMPATAPAAAPSATPAAGADAAEPDATEPESSSSKAPDAAPRKPAPAKSGKTRAPDTDTSRPTLRKRDEPTTPPIDLLPDAQHAERSLEVGAFYMKKGDYDAAIDRYEEAARLNPKLAKPYLLLGEAYEKKSNAANAVTAYRKYLDLYRTAPDRDKILKRIERLEGKAERGANSSRG